MNSIRAGVNHETGNLIIDYSNPVHREKMMPDRGPQYKTQIHIKVIFISLITTNLHFLTGVAEGFLQHSGHRVPPYPQFASHPEGVNFV